MGNMRACFAVAWLALAACGSDSSKADASIKIQDSKEIDAKVWMDAPPANFDFTCMGNTAPTTATANITLSGTARQVNFNGSISVDPIDGARVDACKAGTTCMGGQNNFGNANSDANGNFSIGPIATSMMPLDAYLSIVKNGSRTVYVYPPAPFLADQGMIPALTYSPMLLQLLPGCGQDDTMNGNIVLLVTDCANAPITDSANLTLSIKQGGNEVMGASVVDLGQLSQMAAGTFIVCNVPPSETTTVGATYNTKALRSHDVRVVTGTTTATILRPGY